MVTTRIIRNHGTGTLMYSPKKLQNKQVFFGNCEYCRNDAGKPVYAFLLLTADQGDRDHGRLAGAPLQKENQHPQLESFYHHS